MKNEEYKKLSISEFTKVADVYKRQSGYRVEELY